MILQSSARSESIHSLLAALKVCARTKDLARGREIHHAASKKFGEANIYIASGLVAMYAKCGCLDEAAGIFQGMEQRDVVCWTALIVGYVQNGAPEIALDLFSQMERSGCDPSGPTLLALLKACVILDERERAGIENGKFFAGRMKLLERTMAIHARAAKSSDSMLSRYARLATCLADTYAKCGSMRDSWRVFDGIENHDVVSWTVLVLGYAQNRQEDLALELFSQMEAAMINPDCSSFLAAVKACSSLAVREEIDASLAVKIKSLERAMAIHSHASNSRCFKLEARKHLHLANAMVDLYAKCESLEDSRRVFDSMEQHDIVSWTSIITGYAHESQDGEEALLLFSCMQEQGFKPDRLACVAAIKACSVIAEKKQRKRWDLDVESLEKAMKIHSWISQLGLERDPSLASSLVDMYAKCGSLIVDARRVFDKILDRDVVSWNSFLFGCVYIGEDELALECYAAMEVAPNSQTFLALLQACGNLGDLKLGKLFHGQILRQGLEGSPVAISLLDFYCKCGSVEVAELVFESSIASPDTVAWNTLIAGHGARGDAIAAFQAFRSMRVQGVDPDSVTFVEIFAACSHAGILDRGREFLDGMWSKFGVAAHIEHFHCMIDVLGRASNVEDAIALARRMPFQPNSVTWTTILDAWRKRYT
ncbi:pentatricopeptide repeat-containing protein At4g39530-like [Selaginella moellendorffii]|uniref:pentatricopeptide repeat-containing protein At4g39530-like n=1 Tax=Selaginella moellendorffii TaxID=88036 RepID=UPI000D1C8D4C|nr:pentatricopeptide repeat-containing protein At4g39530-like [Selaginella moellendorffii]|eukprot:XP_024531918.1 pentatricopeptide repeat-containing protein At4g39530-like [Selaginella moellendorffii]